MREKAFLRSHGVEESRVILPFPTCLSIEWACGPGVVIKTYHQVLAPEWHKVMLLVFMVVKVDEVQQFDDCNARGRVEAGSAVSCPHPLNNSSMVVSCCT